MKNLIFTDLNTSNNIGLL